MSKHYCHCDARCLSKNYRCAYRKNFPSDIKLQNELCSIRAIELDPSKIYTIMLEVGDMRKDEVFDYITKVKALYEAQGIIAVYSATHNGIPMVTINELTSETTENN